MTSLAAWAVPSPISSPITSRSRWPTGFSAEYPRWPKVSRHWWMTSADSFGAQNFAIAASLACSRPSSLRHSAS